MGYEEVDVVAEGTIITVDHELKKVQEQVALSEAETLKATEQAGIAKNEADRATTKAEEASGYVTAATEQATLAGTNAATATEQAGIAKNEADRAHTISEESNTVLTQAKEEVAKVPSTISDALTKAKESGEFNGPQGLQGEKGADGVSPTAKVENVGRDAVVTITDANGTTTANLTAGIDGKDGAPGKDGAIGPQGPAGKTPEKGVDYYTEQDKTEMVDAVIAALPTWTGGAY